MFHSALTTPILMLGWDVAQKTIQHNKVAASSWEEAISFLIQNCVHDFLLEAAGDLMKKEYPMVPNAYLLSEPLTKTIHILFFAVMLPEPFQPRAVILKSMVSLRNHSRSWDSFQLPKCLSVPVNYYPAGNQQCNFWFHFPLWNHVEWG